MNKNIVPMSKKKQLKSTNNSSNEQKWFKGAKNSFI